MEELRQFLETKGYIFTGKEDEEHYHFEKNIEGIDFIFLLVAPHNGNNNRYMFRGDTVENHDRWSNCDYQRFYTSIEDFKENYGQWLIFDEELSN